jgi:hypothetical protein
MFNPILFYESGKKRLNFLAGLVGYYPLNSGATDSSGKGYNGNVFGTPAYSVGKVSNAIDFGNNTALNCIDIPDNSDFSFTNGTNDLPFTISMWVKVNAFSNTGNWLINKRGDTNGTDEWQLLIPPAGQISFEKFQFNSKTTYQALLTPASTIALNTWYHITVTDAGTANINDCKIYVNGVLNTVTRTTTGTYTRMNNGTAKTRVGFSAWVADFNCKHRGLIDELAIWKNRELTANEVLGLYNKGNAGISII